VLDGAMLRPGSTAGQIFAYRDFEPPAALYHREDGSDLRSGLSVAEMDPVLSAHGDGAHGVLGEVVG
jgi:hypothetical protein